MSLFDQLSGRQKLGMAGIAALCLFGLGYWGANVGRHPEKVDVKQGSSPDSANLTTGVSQSIITVHVSGAVKNPGLVTLSPGSRTLDAVQAAGGFSSDASQSGLNLAQLLSDGMQVSVPRIGDSTQMLSAVGPVSLNSGSSDDFESLPGIGPTIATRIIEYRKDHGGFRSIEELMQVKGIGQKLFDRIKMMVVL